MTLEEKMVGFFFSFSFFFTQVGSTILHCFLSSLPPSVSFLHSLLNTQQTKTSRRHSQRQKTQSFREGQGAETKLPFSHLLRAEILLVIKCQAFSFSPLAPPFFFYSVKCLWVYTDVQLLDLQAFNYLFIWSILQGKASDFQKRSWTNNVSLCRELKNFYLLSCSMISQL